MEDAVLTPDHAARLVEAARAGDAAAREAVVSRHLDGVRAVCGRRLSSPHDVADAVQETFLRAFDRLDQVRDAEALGPWLHAIAARVCTDHLRAQGRTTTVPAAALDRAAPGPSPHELAVAADEAGRLHATLATLGARDRRALWLRDAVGLPVATVAEELGLTEGSARVLLARARTRVRSAYHGLAGAVAVGWLRARARVATTNAEPVTVRALAAAQVAVAVAAVVLVGPAAPPMPAAPAPAPGDATAATPASAPPPRQPAAAPATTLDAAASAGRGGPVRGEPAPATPADPPAPPPVVVVTDEPPAGPSHLGFATSDGDGDLAGVEVWGPTSEDGDETASGRDATDEDDDEGIHVGPVVVQFDDLSSPDREGR